MFENAKEGVPRRLKAEPFANIGGNTSMNKFERSKNHVRVPERESKLCIPTQLKFEVSRKIEVSQPKKFQRKSRV